MKKMIIVLVVALLACLFSSCREERTAVIDYQDKVSRVEGSYTENGEVRELVLYFKSTEEGNSCRRVDYSAPSSLAGMSFTLEGDRITAQYGDMRIDGTCFDGEDVFSASRLFTLREEDILEIRGGEGDTTVVTGESGEGTWEAVTDKDGLPMQLTLRDSRGVCSLEVKEIVLFEE